MSSWIVRVDEQFLSMQQRRIVVIRVVTVVDGKTPKVDDQRACQNWMTVKVEARVRKVRHLRLSPMKLDNSCAFDRADVATRATLIKP